MASILGDLITRLSGKENLYTRVRQLTAFPSNVPGLMYASDPAVPWPPTMVSEGAHELTGYQPSDFTEGRIRWFELVHPDDWDRLQQTVFQARRKRRLFAIEYRLVTRSGDVCWVRDRGHFRYDHAGKVISLEGFLRGLPDAGNADGGLDDASHCDTLTQLPDRGVLEQALTVALDRCAPDQNVGLLFVDLDHLKQVNDTLGHDVGDVLLQTAAHRLQSVVDPSMMVARIGGDEFAVVLPHVASETDLITIAGIVLDRLSEPFFYGSLSLDCCASIGASLWPGEISPVPALLREAGMALDVAKATGRGRVVVFQVPMLVNVQRRAKMLNNARRAIAERQIEPHYQPKVWLGSGRLAGFEALLRWRNPQGGLEPPRMVQAAFEDARLATGMGQQVLAAVMQDMRQWLEAGIEFGHVAINAAAAEFCSGRFAEQVLASLRAAAVPPHCLELEVTETVFLGSGAEAVMQALRTLSAEGVRIALDDFGTGYASLLHLKLQPVAAIKIDQSFVHNLPGNAKDAAILSAILNLGVNLGLTTVAEGIETAEQAEYLRAGGCDQGQGYLFGRPAPSASVAHLVTSWQPHHWRSKTRSNEPA
jgi:diguanylate cyclase (GGDEF)-like protein/PAS domain S-box-containing protein